jgi:flagellar hook-basal body protein
MDVIGNNISNVNTVGFKNGRVTFSESFSQMVKGASKSASKAGGTNPMQIGLGVKVGAIDTIVTQGSLNNTNRVFDLAIEGNAFFGVSDGTGTYYTRNGAFQLDSEGYIILPTNGMVLQGKMADSYGNFPPGTAIGNMKVPMTQMAPAKETTFVELGKNLPMDGDSKGKVSYTQRFLHAADGYRAGYDPANPVNGANGPTDPGRMMTSLSSLFAANGSALNIKDGDVLTFSWTDMPSDAAVGNTTYEITLVVKDPRNEVPPRADWTNLSVNGQIAGNPDNLTWQGEAQGPGKNVNYVWSLEDLRLALDGVVSGQVNVTSTKVGESSVVGKIPDTGMRVNLNGNGSLTMSGYPTGVANVNGPQHIFSPVLQTSNPLGTSIVPSAFSFGNYAGPGLGNYTYDPITGISTGALLRPAEQFDVLDQLLTSTGNKLGLETGDPIDLNGSIGAINIDNTKSGPMIFNAGSIESWYDVSSYPPTPSSFMHPANGWHNPNTAVAPYNTPAWTNWTPPSSGWYWQDPTSGTPGAEWNPPASGYYWQTSTTFPLKTGEEWRIPTGFYDITTGESWQPKPPASATWWDSVSGTTWNNPPPTGGFYNSANGAAFNPAWPIYVDTDTPPKLVQGPGDMSAIGTVTPCSSNAALSAAIGGTTFTNNAQTITYTIFDGNPATAYDPDGNGDMQLFNPSDKNTWPGGGYYTNSAGTTMTRFNSTDPSTWPVDLGGGKVMRLEANDPSTWPLIDPPPGPGVWPYAVVHLNSEDPRTWPGYDHTSSIGGNLTTNPNLYRPFDLNDESTWTWTAIPGGTVTVKPKFDNRTLLDDFMAKIRNDFILPPDYVDRDGVHYPSVSVNGTNDDPNMPYGAIVIRSMKGSDFAINRMAVAAQNSNRNALAPTAFVQNAQVSTLREAQDIVPMEVTQEIFDSSGAPHVLTIAFTHTGRAGEWEWKASFAGKEDILAGTGSGKVFFGQDGTVSAWVFDGGGSQLQVDPHNGASMMRIDLNVGGPGDFRGLTQYNADFSAIVKAQDGYGTGALVEVSIDEFGLLEGAFSNGTNRILGQIMLVDFANPGGLIDLSDCIFTVSANSGDPVWGRPLSQSSSAVKPGALEMSNVDLGSEFTNMITTQRGYQANSRIVTVSDSMLEELVNLKR